MKAEAPFSLLSRLRVKIQAMSPGKFFFSSMSALLLLAFRIIDVKVPGSLKEKRVQPFDGG
jgi:hypothetical protein